MRRGEGAVEDSPAEAGIPAAVEDSPVEAGTPAAGVDSSRQVGVGNREAVADNREPVKDSRAAVDNRVAADSRVAADNRVAAGTPAAAAAGNSRPAAASRRKSYRTWHKKCCPGPPGFGNWDRRSAAVCRTRCSISVRGRYWHRTWGILSIAAFHLSITSITICKGNVFLTD